MNDLILWFFNTRNSRILFGLIFAGSVMSPKLNGFSDLVIWFSLGIVMIIALIVSILAKYVFPLWLCYLLMALFVGFMAWLFFAYAS